MKGRNLFLYSATAAAASAFFDNNLMSSLLPWWFVLPFVPFLGWVGGNISANIYDEIDVRGHLNSFFSRTFVIVCLLIAVFLVMDVLWWLLSFSGRFI